MRKYRCIHCGNYFESREYEDIADCGFFVTQPDTCPDCIDLINNPGCDISDLHSDSDPGL